MFRRRERGCRQTAIDIFALTGKIAVDYSEAVSGIEKTSNEARNSESILGKLTTAIGKIGTAIAENFKTKSIDNTKLSLSELSTKISSQETDLEKLKSKYQDLYLTLGENADETKDCAKQIKELSSELKDNKSKLSEAENAADKLDDTIDDVGDSAEKANDGFTVWKATLANLASGAIQSVISKVGELARKIGELTTTAVSNYADYEQLVGGVETLFGDSADTLVKYADSAYKTVQLSANDYMETATSFAASLIQGLGGDTEAAVELTDLAITDMADNANKMGTDIESIQNAYQGFAKQNYTMLDNLKLGYGGTQEEMIRLINNSGILEEEISSLDDVTFDQMIEAIHEIQNQLGITGTSAEEAGTTISGSWASVQALFENILTKVGSELAPTVMDFLSELSAWMESVDWDNFAATIGDSLGSVMEWIQQIDFTSFFQSGLEGVTSFVEGLGGFIDKVLTVVDNVNAFLSVLSAIAPVIVGVVAAFSAFSVITSVIEKVQAAMAVFSNLGTVLGSVAGGPVTLIITAIVGIVAVLVTLWNTNEDFRNAVLDIWEAVKSAFSTAVEVIGSALSTAKSAVEGVASGIVSAFQGMWVTVSGVFNSLVTALQTAWNTICNVVNVAIQLIASILGAAFQIIAIPFQFIWQNCQETIMTVWNAIQSAVSTAVNAVQSVIQTVFNAVKTYFTTVLNTYKTIFTTVFNAVKSVVTTVVNAIKSVITTVFNAVKSTVTTVLNTIKNTFSNVWNGIKTTVSNAVNGVKSTISTGLNAAKTTVSNVLNSIKSKFTSIFDSAKTIVKNAIDKIKGFFNFSWSLPTLKMPHISITGSFSLLPPSVPKFSISWYKKAMEDGMIMNQPTIFGYNSDTNQLMAGGEAGSETVVGTESLMEMIGAAIAVNNEELLAKVDALLELLTAFFPSLLAVAEKDLVLDDDTLVGKIAPKMDKALGKLSTAKERGR